MQAVPTSSKSAVRPDELVWTLVALYPRQDANGSLAIVGGLKELAERVKAATIISKERKTAMISQFVPRNAKTAFYAASSRR